jgi:hypothetical protein
MYWEQSLLNASVEVNRAIFELNRPGYPKDKPYHKAKADERYIEKCIAEAIKDLSKALRGIEEQKTIIFDDD